MKRLLLALIEIALVVWAAIVVFKHDIRNFDQIVPWIAPFILRAWMSKDIADPVFGHETPFTLLKRLAPKRQPKSRWDI